MQTTAQYREENTGKYLDTFLRELYNLQGLPDEDVFAVEYSNPDLSPDTYKLLK